MSTRAASPSTQPPASHWRREVDELRHDLRNPLSEILGFTELLLEETRARRLAALTDGLENIRQAANRILADVNHVLHPDTLRLKPDLLKTVAQSSERLSAQIVAATRELAAHAHPDAPESLAEDLRQIAGSAARLNEIAPPRLERLEEAIVTTEGARTDSPSPFAEKTHEPAAGATVTGTVLVVDDQEANRAVLARRLTRRGHTVDLAENGAQAMERLRARHFDLVLLDLRMPVMDGVETLRQIKAEPALANIPVLMLSALDELDSVVHCIELGAEDYLPKPFPTAILHARVHACLVGKRLSDQLRKYTGWLFGKTLFSHAVAAPASLVLSRQERTILFADIRGFTRWSEQHPPEEAVAMLNGYFEAGERIWADSPVIKTEYTGDEIMGVLPTAADGVRMAQALRDGLGPLLARYGLGLGVGVHTGLVIEGLMGGAEVKAYRFVGDTVNTARRICSEARQGQVLLSETTFAQAEPLLIAAAPFEISMKGKAEPSRVRTLLQVVAPERAGASAPA